MSSTWPHAPLQSLTRQRWLIRGVNWLGDAVMSMPALLQLRTAWPQAHFTLLTPSKLKDLWLGHPAIDDVLDVTPDSSLWSTARRLRQHQFAAALVLPNSTRSALEVCLARIPFRVGYGGRGRRWILTHCVPPGPQQTRMRKRSLAEIRRLIANPSSPAPAPLHLSAHHIHQYLHLTAALGADPSAIAPHIPIQPHEISTTLEKFALHPDAARVPLIGLNAGAEYGSSKRWPEDRFIEVAQSIRQRLPCHWIVFGGPQDIPRAARITERLTPTSSPSVASVTNLAGKTSLRELCVLSRACSVFLTNDTGPMHVAAAVGTPVVVPFGSTSAVLTGPGLPGDPRHHLLRGEAPCAPCYLRECPIDHRCMHSITVASVVDAVLAALPR